MRALWLKPWSEAVSLGTKRRRVGRVLRSRARLKGVGLGDHCSLSEKGASLTFFGNETRHAGLQGGKSNLYKEWHEQPRQDHHRLPCCPGRRRGPGELMPAPSPTRRSGRGRPMRASTTPGFTTTATRTTVSPAITSTGLTPSVLVRSVGGGFMTNSTVAAIGADRQRTAGLLWGMSP